mmetsp:Transcript_1394/g.1798  ORF Transcript_1394/g.1798 Transcript_1394/m.1798 type:complete len:85 (-) Transcript_1394:182-436(-)
MKEYYSQVIPSVSIQTSPLVVSWVPVASIDLEVNLDKIINQKKETAAMNGTRKCGGITLNVRHCTGVHNDQLLKSNPRSITSVL